jgi:hypothetical protein
MLAEIMLTLFTPATRKARKDGYLNASVNLWSIAHHCKKSWLPHEENCHALIHNALENRPRKRTVVVFGSGLLRDIPLTWLRKTFEKVMLVDVVHPLSARMSTHFFKNVDLVTLDLNGERVTNAHAVSPLGFLYDRDDIDAVISANVLSQLALEPRQNLPEAVVDEEADAYAAQLISAHVNDLLAFTCPVVLLTDTIMITRDKNGRNIDTHDLLYGVALPTPDRQWVWHLAPLGFEKKNALREHHVHGYFDLKTGCSMRSPT